MMSQVKGLAGSMTVRADRFRNFADMTHKRADWLCHWS